MKLYFKRVRLKYRPCPMCNNRRDLTRHHVIPKKLRTGNEASVYICRECHDRVEEEIAALEREILIRRQEIYWKAMTLIKGGSHAPSQMGRQHHSRHLPRHRGHHLR